MNIYTSAEKRLAELRGHTSLTFSDAIGKWVATGSAAGARSGAAVPAWARSNDDSLALMLEHTKGYQEREIDGKVCIVVTPKTADLEPSSAYLKDHLYNKATALRFAVISSAIAQAEQDLQMASASASSKPAADAKKLLPETFLITLDVLQASFDKYADGVATHPWSVVSSAVEQALGAYRGTPAFTSDYAPATESEAPVDTLIDQINELARAWTAYKNAATIPGGSFSKARDAIVYVLDALSDFRATEPKRNTTFAAPALPAKLEA